MPLRFAAPRLSASAAASEIPRLGFPEDDAHERRRQPHDAGADNDGFNVWAHEKDQNRKSPA